MKNLWLIWTRKTFKESGMDALKALVHWPLLYVETWGLEWRMQENDKHLVHSDAD